ncbi:MAG: hypothetical protein D6796_05490 [Caldilineae bacterium]|nr:MAG: hypothetical protein D6796_05490 [Caldilineae bacterium]
MNMNLIITPLIGILEILKWLIVARVLLSWLPMAGVNVPTYHPAVQWLYRLTDPLLRPLRSFSRMGMLDLSPLIAWFILGFIQQILRGRSIAQTIAFAVVLVIAFSVHEFSHAWVAYRLGDPTAKNAGRLTLDPRKHLDVLGSIMVLAVGFGWAKPVPVNPYNLRNGPKAGMAMVAAAGPLSNLAMAALVAIPVRLGFLPVSNISGYLLPSAGELVFTFIVLNVVLLFFNLLPIAPLDGFRVVAGLLPYPTSQTFQRLEPLGPLILLILVFFGGPLFSGLIFGPTRLVVNLLI